MLAAARNALTAADAAPLTCAPCTPALPAPQQRDEEGSSVKKLGSLRCSHAPPAPLTCPPQHTCQLQRDEEGSSAKKPRVVWSVEMHQQFVAAVNALGIDSE